MLNRKLESIAINTAKWQTMIKASAYAKGNYLAGIFNADKLIKSCKFVLK
jgi:hypothetical protein